MADRDKRYVDPMFYIPEGIDEDTWAYREDADEITVDNEDTSLSEEASDEFGDVDSDVTIVDEGDASEDDAPMVIDNLEVISQVLRRANDGSQVVDIVVEVDDIPGITNYEFRVTKV